MRQFSFLQKFKSFLKQGASPKKLAGSATIGLLLGVIPLLGVTTLLMSAISVRWRLNLPLMLAVSFLIYPLQIVLLIPFVRVGEWMTGAKPTGLSFAALSNAFKTDFLAAMSDLGIANLQALAGWGLMAVPCGLAVYAGLFPVFTLIVEKRNLGSDNSPIIK